MATGKTGAKTTTKKTTTKKSSTGGVPQISYKNIGGDIKAGTVTAPQITTPDMQRTNTDFNVQQVTTNKIAADQVTASTVAAPDKVTADQLANRTMTAADYTVVDPSQIASQYGDINRSETSKNAALSSEIALQNLDTELKGLQNYVPAMQALKQSTTASDNAFNQMMRDEQLASVDPNLRADLEKQRSDYLAYANGQLPDSVQDRALELGLRSQAADAAASGGFGVGSGAAKKASELMSAAQRFSLAQYGEQGLTSNIQNRAQLLLAPLEYSNAGEQVNVMPSQSASQMAMSIASQMDQGNITPQVALASLAQQGQFKSQLQQQANIENLTVGTQRDIAQGQMNLQAGEFNSQQALQASEFNASAQTQVAEFNAGNNLQAAQFNEQNSLNAQQINASNSLQAQISGAQIQSSESQALAQLQWNTANANAQRSFEASNINVTNAIQVAENNRATRLQVATTNKNMIFQNMELQKQIQGQKDVASIGASATVRAAGIAASAQNNATAANVAMHNQDIALAQQQQASALQIYEDNRSSGQSNATASAIGNTITQLPSIISGVSSSISSIANLFSSGNSSSSNSDYNPQRGDAIGQNADGSYIYY